MEGIEHGLFFCLCVREHRVWYLEVASVGELWDGQARPWTLNTASPRK